MGTIFRFKQIEPALNIPTPNGFSLENNLLTLFEKDLLKEDIITQMLSYGYLEEGKHNSTKKKHPKKNKYYLNALFCPYFGISLEHLKHPLSIRGDEREFIQFLLSRSENIDENMNKIKKFINWQRKDTKFSYLSYQKYRKIDDFLGEM